ncbi:alpha/beta fold hydrolase [Nocardia sp. NPDC050406]|uniref:alpha/beta fold hydrolase n=1 Tax=Nocardia sp. NPDC050406 TaxID=3364318 RepID=UPI0037AE536E
MGRWLGFGTEDLAALDIRLIAVDRPGLGASDPDPERTLLDWADDIRALALPNPAVVGFSQGAPFALACAATGLASAVAIVSGGDELAYPAFADTLIPEVRHLVRLAETDPAAAEMAFTPFAEPEAMWRMGIDASPAEDRAVYLAPEFDKAFRRALADGFTQGPSGYIRDTLLHMTPWPFDLSKIAVPVDLWYGERDTNPTHSPDHGSTLAARIPGAHLHLVPEAGGALLWTHARSILETLLARR